MPSYDKFLKKILSNKQKLDDTGTMVLTVECSAIIQNKLAPKLKDLGSFSIPYVIGNTIIDRALSDLGESVSLMPMSICKILYLCDVKPIKVSLLLDDKSINYPIGIIENASIKIGQLYIPTDFIVMGVEEDAHILILLGTPFWPLLM